MSWLKIDDGFFEHEKIEDLSHQAFRLHVGALCICARLLTDGHVSETNLRKVAVTARVNAKRYVDELVEAKLWTPEPVVAGRSRTTLSTTPQGKSWPPTANQTSAGRLFSGTWDYGNSSAAETGTAVAIAALTCAGRTSGAIRAVRMTT